MADLFEGLKSQVVAEAVDEDAEFCNRCGAEMDVNAELDDRGQCDECHDVARIEDAVELAVVDPAAFGVELASMCFNSYSVEVGNLINEAYDNLRSGDPAECMHRLSLAIRPKFSSVEECQNKYQATMFEQRRLARKACV